MLTPEQTEEVNEAVREKYTGMLVPIPGPPDPGGPLRFMLWGQIAVIPDDHTVESAIESVHRELGHLAAALNEKVNQ